jgi:hypothetical protein
MLTHVNKIDLVDWTPKINSSKINNTWYEGNNLLLWTYYKGLFMALVSFVKGRYTHWFSKTTNGSGEGGEIFYYGTRKTFLEVVTKE